MDMTVGTEYYSKRGWAPNGDFRYKGSGLDHLTARWNALIDRGIELPITTGSTTMVLTNEGGVDINALGRKDLSSATRLAGKVEYLSSYVYRLVFNDDYWQAVSSEVQSDVSLTNVHRDLFPPSRWTGSRPLRAPRAPLSLTRPPSTPTRRGFFTFPACALTCWTGR